MKFWNRSVFRTVFESDRRVYRTGKKAIFALCFVAVLAQFFPTQHSGDIIDIIWSSLYWSAPTLALLVFLILIVVSSRSVDS